MNTNNKELDAKVSENNSDFAKSIDIQQQLYELLINDNFNLEEWMNKFYEYEERHPRFFYSYITQYIFDEENDDRIGRLLVNINSITERIDYSDSTKELSGNERDKSNSTNKIAVSKSQYLMICKLYDHCHLANKQRQAYKETKKDIETKIRETATSTIKENEELIYSKIRDYEKSITSQLLGLVAIFTALSFVIFGGISSFGSIFQIIKDTPLLKTLIVLDVWFVCMFNLFALFIKMIAMITDKHLEITKYILLINTALVSILILLIILLYNCKIINSSLFSPYDNSCINTCVQSS